MEDSGRGILAIIKGILVALVVTLGFVVVFTFVLRFTNFSDVVFKIIDQAIKVIGIFIGCMVGIVGGKKGLLKGLLIGLLVTVINYLIFSILSSDWGFSWWTVLDMLFGVIAGGICGMFTALLKKGR